MDQRRCFTDREVTLVKIMAHLRFIWISIVLLGVMLLGFSSCSNQTATQNSTSMSVVSKPVESWVADGIIKDGEYSATAQYDNFQIFWRSDDQYAYISLRARTAGFVAVGLQPGARMKNSDIIFGYFKEGNTTLYDMFSTGDFGPHVPDVELGGTNNILEYGGSEDSSFTTIEFKRTLTTGDKYDIDFVKGKNKIIWSYGSGDETSKKHNNTGYGEIDLTP
jgi:hypothetical protein